LSGFLQKKGLGPLGVKTSKFFWPWLCHESKPQQQLKINFKCTTTKFNDKNNYALGKLSIHNFQVIRSILKQFGDASFTKKVRRECGKSWLATR